jgi:hypothetical protein
MKVDFVIESEEHEDQPCLPLPVVLNDIPKQLCEFPVLLQARERSSELQVFNLISNQKSLKIDISPFVFQEFVNKGILQPIGEKDNPQESICYFLAANSGPYRPSKCCPNNHELENF